jgi:hypothetical protein
MANLKHGALKRNRKIEGKSNGFIGYETEKPHKSFDLCGFNAMFKLSGVPSLSATSLFRANKLLVLFHRKQRVVIKEF